MSKEITLYSFADFDRSGKVRWTACELGYTIREERVGVGGHTEAPYLALNPYGQIPAARLDGSVMIESMAICVALAERHPEAGLIPNGRAERDAFWQVATLTNATLEFPIVTFYLTRAGIADAAWAPLIEPRLKPRLAAFAGQVPAEDYWLGGFTLADVFAAFCLRVAVSAGLLPFEGRTGAYLERLMQRPAARQAHFFDALKRT